MKKALICNLFIPYTVNAVKRAFKDLGIGFEEKKYYTPEDLYGDERIVSMVEKDIRSVRPDFVFTVNYWPPVGEACHRTGTTYISWSYDSPQNLPSTKTMEYETNHIFMFDKAEVEAYMDKGIKTVSHALLATDTEHFDRLLSKRGMERDIDISFLGSLYESTLPMLMGPADDYERGFIEGVVRSTQSIYGYFLPDDAITDELIDSLNRTYAKKATVKDVPVINKEQLLYAIATHVTRTDRLTLLKFMSPGRNTYLYTGEKEAGDEMKTFLKDVKIEKSVDYDTGMPEVFRRSKINLCPILRIIRTGIPLRALDIMGCRGFLLSSFQGEIAEHFENGKECVLYTGLEEAMYYADYYLKHDDERERIAMAGYEKVKRDFTYKERIKEMLEVL